MLQGCLIVQRWFGQVMLIILQGCLIVQHRAVPSLTDSFFYWARVTVINKGIQYITLEKEIQKYRKKLKSISPSLHWFYDSRGLITTKRTSGDIFTLWQVAWIVESHDLHELHLVVWAKLDCITCVYLCGLCELLIVTVVQ